jgi:rod shape-determining protein MreC
MESFLNRYRNINVLLLVIMAQLVLLAVDAKVQGVPLIRVWAVTAVTPMARLLEGVRSGSTGFLHNYILLKDTNDENRRLKAELDRIKMENIALRNDLHTADRAKALQLFQARTPSKTVAATVIGTGTGANSRVVFVDRGSTAGIMRGMAVVTPDGIVGKVIAAYPVASQVLLITDPDFAAGVVGQKNAAHGTLKGQGTPQCKVDYVPFEDKIEVGEMLFTSGDDRVFPRGFPVGVVKSVRDAQPFKEVMVEPSGLQHGLQDVLILVEGVHQAIPDVAPGMQPIYIAPPPPSDGTPAAGPAPTGGTEADRLRAQYKALGQTENHTYGENPMGSKPPDFTKLGAQPAQPAAPPATPPAGTPAATPSAPVPATPAARPLAATPKPGGVTPGGEQKR